MIARDKIEHALLGYFLASVFFWVLFGFLSVPLLASILASVLFGGLFGVILEVFQKLNNSGVYDPKDALFTLFGSLLHSVLILALYYLS